jgi:hypothetical protein
MFESTLASISDFASPVTLGVIVIATGCFFWLVSCYKNLAHLRTEIDEAFEKIDVHIKERHHLTPALMEIIQQHTKNSQPAATLMDNAAKARHTMAIATERVRAFSNDASSINSLVNADVSFNLALDHLTALQNSHSSLRTDELFKKLIKDLSTIEGNLSFTHQLYNDVVNSYNHACSTFPSLVIAAALGFRVAGTLTSTKRRNASAGVLSRA